MILSNQLDFLHMDPALKDRIRVCFNRYSTSSTDLEGNPIPLEFRVPRDPQLKNHVLALKGVQHFGKLMMDGLSDMYMDPSKADPEVITNDTKNFLERYKKSKRINKSSSIITTNEMIMKYSTDVLKASAAHADGSFISKHAASACLSKFREYVVSAVLKKTLPQTATVTAQDLGRGLKRAAKEAGLKEKQWKASRRNNQQHYKVTLIKTSEKMNKLISALHEGEAVNNKKGRKEKKVVDIDASQL